VLHGPHVREVARDLAGRLFDRADPAERPTAVFAASDTQALGVLEAARSRGIDVPGELSVVGFDDIEVSSYAGLTTVRQPLLQSGKTAVALLLEALTSEDPPAPEIHELGLELALRSTTAPPPTRP
jgi:DNA-binding LacI/PurR family transcriptional regulator